MSAAKKPRWKRDVTRFELSDTNSSIKAITSSAVCARCCPSTAATARSMNTLSRGVSVVRTLLRGRDGSVGEAETGSGFNDISSIRGDVDSSAVRPAVALRTDCVGGSLTEGIKVFGGSTTLNCVSRRFASAASANGFHSGRPPSAIAPSHKRYSG